MKRKKFLIPGILMALLGLAGRIGLAAAKNDVIVSGGMQAFRTWLWVSRGLLLAGGVLLAAALAIVLLARKDRKRTEQNLATLRAAERKAKAPLSTESGRFNEQKMRELLNTRFERAPNEVLVYQARFQTQLDRMNEYQANLSRLLRDNDVTELSEAEAFLDKVEQNIFGKMRQVYNILMMYDEAAPITELTTPLEDALAHNDKALEQARRLNAAVTEYVNHQGTPQDSIGSVEVFIKVLQEELV